MEKERKKKEQQRQFVKEKGGREGRLERDGEGKTKEGRTETVCKGERKRGKVGKRWMENGRGKKEN